MVSAIHLDLTRTVGQRPNPYTRGNYNLTQAIIDHGAAREKLESAIAAARADGFRPRHAKRDAISDVMLGRHLTYRYVLLTNLLAKATNGRAHGLALQAGADLDGAFDSRSLCHKVVVDFDRDPNQLAGKLGRSNEPYLNKPARYTALTSENAVRRGTTAASLRSASTSSVGWGMRPMPSAPSSMRSTTPFSASRLSARPPSLTATPRSTRC